MATWSMARSRVIKGASEVVRMADKADAFQSVTQSARAAVAKRPAAPKKRRKVRQVVDMMEFILKVFELMCHNFHKFTNAFTRFFPRLRSVVDAATPLSP